MRNLKLKYNHSKYSNEKLNKSISSILDLNTLLSMATIKDKNESYINTVYYAYNNKLNLYYLSPPDTQHSKNLDKNSSAAISIFDSRQNPPTINKRGLQIFGICKLAKSMDLIDGFREYSVRYGSILKYIKKPGDLLKKIRLFWNRYLVLKMGILAFFYSSAATLFYYALQISNNASQVAAINQSQIIVTVLLAMIFLKERKSVFRKVIGAILSLIGTIILVK